MTFKELIESIIRRECDEWYNDGQETGSNHAANNVYEGSMDDSWFVSGISIKNVARDLAYLVVEDSFVDDFTDLNWKSLNATVNAMYEAYYANGYNDGAGFNY